MDRMQAVSGLIKSFLGRVPVTALILPDISDGLGSSTKDCEFRGGLLANSSGLRASFPISHLLSGLTMLVQELTRFNEGSPPLGQRLQSNKGAYVFANFAEAVGTMLGQKHLVILSQLELPGGGRRGARNLRDDRRPGISQRT